MELHLLCPQGPRSPKGQHRTFRCRQHGFSGGVIQVDDRFVTSAEQLCLGIPVGLHGLVEIQVVLRQVGKGRHIVAHPAHPVQGNGVAGYLHHSIFAACLTHSIKEALQLQAFRGGPLGGDLFGTDAVAHGANEAHLGPPGLLQHRFQKQGDGGFSVGARNAHQLHGLCRVAIEVAGDLGQSQPVLSHQHIGHILLRPLGGDHHRRPPVHGHGDKPVSVGSESGNGHKQPLLFHLPGIIRHAPDFRLRVCVKLQYLYILQKRL